MKRVLLFMSLLLCAALGIIAYSHLPNDGSPIVQEKYAGWSGVLRVWVCDDLRIGGTSPISWLNACATAFEKSHKGIYVNVQTVPSEAIARMDETGINPPDMIIWPAGLLDDADYLIELSGEYPLRLGLDISPYAVPVLTGAHFWIFDTDQYSALPNDMYDVSSACRNDDAAALVALSTGLRAGETVEKALPGVDLGLVAAPTAMPETKGDVKCRASRELILTDEPHALFSEGEVEAFVGDMRDLARLGDESGWGVCVTGEYTYIDEMALCSIIDTHASSADERQSLCQDLISLMLGEGQALAARAGAMPAAIGAAAYAGDATLAAIEAALEPLICVTPPAFGKADTLGAADKYIQGALTADEAIDEIIRSFAR